MNIVVLTASEPLYLPAFFGRYLEARAHSTRAIFMAPPCYGDDSTLDTARKYRRAFGWCNLGRLGWRTLGAKLRDRVFRRAVAGQFYSIRAAAVHHGIPCETIADLNAESFRERLRSLNTDLIVSVSCPQIFRRPLIELPRHGSLNIHGALLPHYRGIAPSFWMMANGEKTAGLTVFLVNEDIDRGSVVETVEFPFQPDESLHEFIVRSKQIACDALLRAIDKIESGDIQPAPLPTDGGSYYSFPTREAYREFPRRVRRLW